MRNTGLDEAQAEIKIAGRNINNVRYVVVLKQQDKGLVAINEIHFRTYCLLHYLEFIINNKLFFPKLNFNNFPIYFTEEKLKI